MQAIRRSAERAFTELGLRDVARLDGWVHLDAEFFKKQREQEALDHRLKPKPVDPGEDTIWHGQSHYDRIDMHEPPDLQTAVRTVPASLRANRFATRVHAQRVPRCLRTSAPWLARVHVQCSACQLTAAHCTSGAVYLWQMRGRACELQGMSGLFTCH